MLRAPTALLTWFAGRSLGGNVSLQCLVGDKSQVLLHPSDLVISGREADAAHARAVLGERLTVTHAYLTWTKESNEVEDEIRRAWQALGDHRAHEAAGRLARLEDRLHALTVPYEEWEVLFRQTLLAQRGLLAADSRALRPASFADRVRGLFRRAA
jgi:hypothetical protein